MKALLALLMKALLALLMTLVVAPVGASDKAEWEARDERWRQLTEKLAEQEKAAKEAASKRSDWWAGSRAWDQQGYASWMKFQEDKVRAERASMAAFDCMFLAVQVGGAGNDEGDKYKQEAERLFLYAYEQAKGALPYSANPNAFVPYREPEKLSDDFWIGTLFSDARARTSILLQSDTLPSLKAFQEFRARNCDLIGVGR